MGVRLRLASSISPKFTFLICCDQPMRWRLSRRMQCQLPGVMQRSRGHAPRQAWGRSRVVRWCRAGTGHAKRGSVQKARFRGGHGPRQMGVPGGARLVSSGGTLLHRKPCGTANRVDKMGPPGSAALQRGGTSGIQRKQAVMIYIPPA